MDLPDTYILFDIFLFSAFRYCEKFGGHRNVNNLQVEEGHSVITDGVVQAMVCAANWE